jgi:hypothetical protein
MIKNLIFTLLLSLNLVLTFGQDLQKKYADSIRFSSDTLDGIYIPKNLNDCFDQIDGFWSDSLKKVVTKWSEREFRVNAHFGFGLWMRNNWQLWGGSRLSKYFNTLGIFHPDDMSGTILTSYHRHLNDEDIKLQEQIDDLKIWWKVNREPLKDDYPKGVKKLEFDTKYLYTLKKDNIPGCIFLQTNSLIGKVWIYDYHFGWKKLPRSEIRKLDQITPEEREDFLNGIFKK